MKKQYQNPEVYESKLDKVMQRLGVESYDFDWSRRNCWVAFYYKGQNYKFEHSIENANAHGVKIQYGSDIFAQVVLTLEDLARMVEREIYDLSSYIAGMKCLPEHEKIPNCFNVLLFSSIPSEEELKTRYRQLCKSAHPDAGGNEEQFLLLKDAYDDCIKILKEKSE